MVVKAKPIPRFEPVKASAFSTLAVDVRGMLIDNGAVPVNDVFFDLWDDYSKILLLYGGYGSGKSVFIVDKLLKHCLNDDYFRCFYGRKIHDTVRISVFATLCDRIEELHLTHLFSYSRADNSSMVIRCRANGNAFFPFGADNADKLKSVKDPSHIFCEEMDQFTEKDFGVLLSRLRTTKVPTQFIGAFNTTAVTDGHWIKQALFSESTSYSKYSLRKCFCNYTDNYFINREEYEQTLWISAAFNETKFREISGGEWGSEQKDNLFIYAFRPKDVPNRKPGYSHLVEGLEVDYNLPLYVSFDFNVDPCTALICQHASDRSWISIIDEIRLAQSDVYEVCDRIKTNYPGAFIIVTGDASGRNRSAMTRGSKNYYFIIKQDLELNNNRFKLPSENPSHKNSRALTNSLFAKHPALVIDKRCKYLIEDLQNMTADDEGGIADNKDAHKGHLMDCLRYYFNYFHGDFIIRLKKQAA